MNAFETNIADSVLGTEHRMLRDETRTFVENEVRPEARERDPDGEHMSDDLVRQLGEMGFSGSSSTRSTTGSDWI